METLRNVLDMIGTVVLLLAGVGGFLRPTSVAAAQHFQLSGPRGIAEFRIAGGGVLIALGLVALILQVPASFHMIAAIWLGGAIARVIALVLDKPGFDATYKGFLALETIMGVLMLI